MTVDIEATELIAKHKELERQRAAKIREGFTPEAWQEYKQVEQDRARQGYPSITELEIDHRTYNRLRRFGTQTIPGAFELFEKGLKPEDIAQKRLEEVREAINSFIDRYVTDHPEAVDSEGNITLGPRTKSP